jgi:hypothetical protein
MSMDRVKDKLANSMRKVYYGPQPLVYGQKYFYVLGFTKLKNKKVFWGPMSEEEAYVALGELQDGEKFDLATRDPHRAVREVRDILIKRGVEPDEALRRLLHKRDGEQEQQKQPSVVSKLFQGHFIPGPSKGIAKASPLPKSVRRKVQEGLDLHM